MVSKETLEDAVGSAVPMHTKVIANQDFLHSLVSDQTLPPDDDKHHFFLKPKQLSHISTRYSEFSDLLAFNVRGAKGKRGPKQLASLEYHFQCILLSLSWAIYRRQWVLVALDNHASSKYRHIIKRLESGSNIRVNRSSTLKFAHHVSAQVR